MRLLVLSTLATAAMLAAAPAVLVARTSAEQTSFAFGRTGGNIAPFSVEIAADGSVAARGPVRVGRHQLSARTVSRLATVAATQHFFALRRQVICPGTLPDFAFRSVTVRTAHGSRTVLVRGGCRPGFNALYTALSTAVGTS
jgi:hypothetical protein